MRLNWGVSTDSSNSDVLTWLSLEFKVLWRWVLSVVTRHPSEAGKQKSAVSSPLNQPSFDDISSVDTTYQYINLHSTSQRRTVHFPVPEMACMIVDIARR